MNEKTQEFIQSHLNDDVHNLSLLASQHPEVDMPLAIRQITGKQKVETKIPTFFKCENILYPQRLSLEQSSSEITAKHKAASCEGEVLIDLTGGFGVDCFFLSANFKHTYYVEQQKELCELAEHNFSALGRKNITVLNEVAESFLQKTIKADWIYLDPARRTESGKKAVLLSDCEPDAGKLLESLLEKTDHLMIKLSPMFDIEILKRELKYIREIQIIAVENECKEIVAILEKSDQISVEIKTTNYPRHNAIEIFNFIQDTEQISEATYSNYLKKYLYEPNAAIMKSGAFKLISERYKIDKLHINSHLYTSDNLITDFPGRIFYIEKSYNFSKKSVKLLHSEVKKANLTVRNFPISVSELRKKLKLADGGEVYLFATTLSDNNKILIKSYKTT